MAQARGSALLSKRRKYLAATTDDRFNFSQNDDFEELAKGLQWKNTKLSNSWAPIIYSKWAKARREYMEESNITEMSLLTDNNALCKELW